MLTVKLEENRVPSDDAVRGDGYFDELAELRRLCADLQAENERLRAAFQELERVAQRDTLTPLFNRRHFLTALKKRLAVLAVGEARGAVVFMDVNQLKRINDRYGHAAGDFALVEIAARVHPLIGEDEIAARIGGDEFGFLLNAQDLAEAEERIAELSDALTEKPSVFEERTIPLSACFGVAMLRGGESGVSILAEADRDMYEAKHGGLISAID
jgi:diguanylate cyclase (GGDEF)-like protein